MNSFREALEKALDEKGVNENNPLNWEAKRGRYSEKGRGENEEKDLFLKKEK